MADTTNRWGGGPCGMSLGTSVVDDHLQGMLWATTWKCNYSRDAGFTAWSLE